jgi:hypothetical protein
MHRSSAILLLTVLVGCSRLDGGGKPSDVAADVARAYAAGELGFDIRGLKNQAASPSYGGTNFVHRGTVVALGDSSLARRPYWVLFAVKRIAGGDPEDPRTSDDFVLVFVRDGVGEVEESGGYRTASEKWEPEQIELTPIAVVPLIPISGPAVRS